MAEFDPNKKLEVDAETGELVERLAQQLGISEAEAVRDAVLHREAELARENRVLTAREKLEKFWREHPLPPPTGLKADKAFFDELSGDL
ncbi:MAG: type II toxin-antitoxin system VapB family antitoxin [Sphingomonas sp.]|jgi:antitoxin VapB